ncbi:MAG: triose-phosphate isomerase [Candidatus Adlerbacteria bacterium]|nr:triose-phosphate isomerase [Candidatus Adlerbacteria bacterium]
MKKYIVAGNWKLYIERAEEAKKIAAVLKRKVKLFPGVDMVLFPPAPLLPAVAQVLGKTSVALGAQTISVFSGGAHTGDVSGAVVKDLGASWVLVGHSERRAAGETNDMVCAQVRAAKNAGLHVMLCVGEKEKDHGGAHFSDIALQLSSALNGFSNPPAGGRTRIAIAYEPVWAIGKTAAEAMQPGELEEMVIFIRKTLTDILDRTAALRVPILYGGSVDGSNARQLLREGGVSGFLVGRASTDIDAFTEILNVCKK